MSANLNQDVDKLIRGFWSLATPGESRAGHLRNCEGGLRADDDSVGLRANLKNVARAAIGGRATNRKPLALTNGETV